MTNIITLILIACITVCCGQRRNGSSQFGDGHTTHVVELSHRQFDSLVYDTCSGPGAIFLGARPAVVDFYALWCDPCNTISPIIDQLSVEYAGRVDFYKVDVDVYHQIASRMRIRAMPTVYFIPVTGQPEIVVGARGSRHFANLIEGLLRQDIRAEGTE